MPRKDSIESDAPTKGPNDGSCCNSIADVSSVASSRCELSVEIGETKDDHEYLPETLKENESAVDSSKTFLNLTPAANNDQKVCLQPTDTNF